MTKKEILLYTGIMERIEDSTNKLENGGMTADDIDEEIKCIQLEVDEFIKNLIKTLKNGDIEGAKGCFQRVFDFFYRFSIINISGKANISIRGKDNIEAAFWHFGKDNIRKAIEALGGYVNEPNGSNRNVPVKEKVDEGR